MESNFRSLTRRIVIGRSTSDNPHSRLTSCPSIYAGNGRCLTEPAISHLPQWKRHSPRPRPGRTSSKTDSPIWEDGQVRERSSPPAPRRTGPLAQVKELIGGYIIVDADSLDEAAGVARACPALCGPAPGWRSWRSMPRERTLTSGAFLRHGSGCLVASLSRRAGVHHRDAIDGAAQASLMAALESWTSRRTPDNPWAWLFRVAQNHLTRELRKRARQRRRLEVGDDLLRRLFVCCVEAIPVESQLVLADISKTRAQEHPLDPPVIVSPGGNRRGDSRRAGRPGIPRGWRMQNGPGSRELGPFRGPPSAMCLREGSPADVPIKAPCARDALLTGRQVKA